MTCGYLATLAGAVRSVVHPARRHIRSALEQTCGSPQLSLACSRDILLLSRITIHESLRDACVAGGGGVGAGRGRLRRGWFLIMYRMVGWIDTRTDGSSRWTCRSSSCLGCLGSTKTDQVPENNMSSWPPIAPDPWHVEDRPNKTRPKKHARKTRQKTRQKKRQKNTPKKHA